MKKFFKKIGYSITKIEKYPEMATDGIKAALKYLAGLVIIIVIISNIVTIYKTHETVIKELANYIDGNIPEFTYKDNELKVEKEQPIRIENQDAMFNKVIIDVNQENEEEIKKYEQEIKDDKTGVLILKDKLEVINENNSVPYNYSDLATQMGISEFSKSDVLNYLRGSGMISVYVGMFITLFITTFIYYFIDVVVTAAILAGLGYVVALLLKVRMRYKAVFNMAAYAMTLSVLLQAIYILIVAFTDFRINLFEVMYLGVAFIYLIASIFLTRIDLMKTQEELTKVKEAQKEVKEEIKEEEKKQEEEEKKENKENKKEKENDGEKKKESKKDKKDLKEQGGEPEGSNV